MGKCSLCLFLLFSGLLLPARAQYANVSAAGGPVEITTPWRFHTGDNPQWASPDFDDSHWSLMRMDESWAAQGYRDYWGFAWYRLKVKLPAGKQRLAIAYREVGNGDEYYVNGQLIGASGRLRPAPVWTAYNFIMRGFPLPPSLNGKTVELAIRTWEPHTSATDYNGIGLSAPPRVGTEQAIANLTGLVRDRFMIAHIPAWLLSVTAAGIGLFSLVLFALRPRAAEYAWAALFLLADAWLAVSVWLMRIYQWSVDQHATLHGCVVAVMLICWLLFIWSFLRAKPDRLLYAAIAVSLLFPLTAGLGFSDHIAQQDTSAINAVALLALGILVLARLVRLAWRGNRDAQLLLVPFLLSSAMRAVEDAMAALYRAGMIQAAHDPVLYLGPDFTVYWDDFFTLLAYLSVGAVLVLRFTRSAERAERLSAEMEAAHRVQAQLVPTLLPATPHFRFDAAYLAASEVGGDFYQVFPHDNGSVLIAVGDVSGKGLKAAMLGTLVVGALRSLAQENLSPSGILTRLNLQLVQACDGGFVTCLVLRLFPDGRAEAASAGHLPPYRNGEELPLHSGLPLGISSAAEYSTVAFALQPGNVAGNVVFHLVLVIFVR